MKKLKFYFFTGAFLLCISVINTSCQRDKIVELNDVINNELKEPFFISLWENLIYQSETVDLQTVSKLSQDVKCVINKTLTLNDVIIG